MADESSNFPKVNPFCLSDKDLSTYIIASHNPKAKIHDVDHLYNKVSNIIKEASSNHRINKHLELKYGERKVSHDNNFVPKFQTLKYISSQITNPCSDAYTTHERIMQILEKLRIYNWATKGVMVLASFALDYGEPWHVFKIAPTKTNLLEIHISSTEDLEKPTNATDYKTLVDLAMQLIKVVIDLDKLIVKNDELRGTVEDVLYQVPRDIYIYWAIFALSACASEMAPSELIHRIGAILSGFSGQWKPQIVKVDDYLWRLNVFRSPLGVLQLLTALIFPKDIPYLEIYDITTKSLVSPDELKTKYLLLFISEVQFYMKEFIEILHPIHKSFMMDPKKSNYRILWVPVEKEWNDETKERFNELKSMMPWYIVEYLEPIKGYRLLKELWEYYDTSSVVVVDPQGNVLNPDASDLIIRWDDDIAFPFTLERQKQLLKEYGWFWNLLDEATAIGIFNWLDYRSYIFVYGGIDEARVNEFGQIVERIKRDTILLSKGDVKIEHLNLGEKLEISKKFWGWVTTKFQETITNKKDGDDDVILEMEMLLAMKNEKVWALFSKGRQVMVVDYDPVIFDTLEGFENWQANIMKQGFDKTFIDYYQMKRSQELERHCCHFQLENLAFAPHNVICPEPDCKLKMKMEIESIKYTCCHEMLKHLKVTPKKKGDEATLHS